jgi:hypothetical protein
VQGRLARVAVYSRKQCGVLSPRITQSSTRPSVTTRHHSQTSARGVCNRTGPAARCHERAIVIAALHREIARIIALPDTTERLAALGLDPVGMTPEELATLIKVESEKWAKVIQAANINIKAQ